MQVKSIAECSKHSAILLTFIKLPFAIKIFVLSFLSGCLRHVLLYWLPTCTFCFVEFVGVTVRWIVLLKWDFFHNYKGWVHWAHCLVKWWAIFWNHGTMTLAHHKSEGLEPLTQIQNKFTELFLMMHSTKIFSKGSTTLIIHSQVSDPGPKGPLVKIIISKLFAKNIRILSSPSDKE